MLELLKSLWHPDLILRVQRIFGPGWRLVFEGTSLLGGAQITLVAVAWARWFRGRHLTARLLLALFIGIGVDLLIWNLFPTPRPDDPLIRVSSTIPISSFPSGHLVTTLTLWGTLAAEHVIPALAVAVVALLVALGRLDLGEHYPGDVLGGIAIGLLILGVVAWLWPRLRARCARLAWPRLFQLGVAVAVIALLSTPLVPPGRWQLLGILAGIAIGVPLEVHFVDFVPQPYGWREILLRLAIGLAGFFPLALGIWLFKHLDIVSQLVIPFLVALWIVLGAPAMFRWREQGQLSATQSPVSASSTSVVAPMTRR